jgi:hypothetical protein
MKMEKMKVNITPRLLQTKVLKMKISKIKPGEYVLTGHMAGELVQYTIEKNAHIWQVTKIYGSGPDFHLGYDTMREATATVIAYADY